MEKLKNTNSMTGEVLHLLIDGFFFALPGVVSLVYSILIEIHALGFMDLSRSDFLVAPIWIYFLVMTVVYAFYFFTRKRNGRGRMNRISGPTPLASLGLMALVASLLILKYATPVGTTHFLGEFGYAPAMLLCGAGLYTYVEASWQ